MPERRKMPNNPNYTFSCRAGNTNFDVNVFCSPDTEVTFEDRLLDLIRNEIVNDIQQQDPHNDGKTAA